MGALSTETRDQRAPDRASDPWSQVQTAESEACSNRAITQGTANETLS